MACSGFGLARLDADSVQRLIRTVASDLKALEEAAALRRRQIPGPGRILDPLNEALERTRIRILGGLNDLRAALVFAAFREVENTRAFTRKAEAKMAAAEAELAAAAKLPVADSALCQPVESVLEHVVVALRAIQSTGTELRAHLT